jgi:Trypsin-like peptidase domain
MGTGLLVAPDIVLTSYHVVEPVFTGGQNAANVRVRFDYIVLAGGEVRTGVVVELHRSQWDIDHSSCTADEKNDLANPQLPSGDQLDYALLRLARYIRATAVPNATVGRVGVPPG